VTRDATERLTQDYLDGRLSDEERRRFEARLERDPELAAEVEALREIGSALREGDEELSPGFYTRARARFAEAQAPPARRWFQLISWETAGLATAVLIAAALFVPSLVMREIPEGPDLEFGQRKAPEVVITEAEEPDRTESRIAARERSGSIDENRPTEPSLAAVDDVSKQIAREKKSVPPAKMKADVAEPESRIEEKPADSKNEQWAPVPPATPLEDRAVEMPEQEVAAAPAPRPKDKGSTATAPVEEQKKRLQKNARVGDVRYADAESDEKLRQAEQAPLAGAAAGAEGSGRLEAVAAAPERLPGTLLSPGVVEPGTVRIVDSEQEWEALRDGLDRDTLAEAAAFDSTRRALLIGAREAPFECRWVRVTRDEGSYRVRLLPAAEDGLPAHHGCMIVLPRDGREIVMDYSAGPD
jgi:hypothetical protein